MNLFFHLSHSHHYENGFLDNFNSQSFNKTKAYRNLFLSPRYTDTKKTQKAASHFKLFSETPYIFYGCIFFK